MRLNRHYRFYFGDELVKSHAGGHVSNPFRKDSHFPWGDKTPTYDTIINTLQGALAVSATAKGHALVIK